MERGIYEQPTLPHTQIETMLPLSDSEVKAKIEALVELSSEIELNLENRENMPAEAPAELEAALVSIDLQLAPLFAVAEQRGIFARTA